MPEENVERWDEGKLPAPPRLWRGAAREARNMTDVDFVRRTWAKIDLDAVEHNAKAIRRLIAPGCKIMAMVKADAYGHGAPQVARALAACGVEYFGVSSIDEALQLRRAGIDAPLLIAGYTPAEGMPLVAEHGVTQTVFSLGYAKDLSAAAVKVGKTIRVHLKADTGMTRLGFMCQSPRDIARSVDEMTEAASLPGLFCEGIFTHFAVSDDKKSDYTRLQFDNFLAVMDGLERRGVRFALRHCCNSAAIINFPEMHLDMVRPGLIIYGMYPSRDRREGLDLVPAMSLQTVAAMVKEVDAGVFLSYGLIHKTERKTVVATLPVGYADGYLRRLSGRASVLIAGRRAPVIGRVCMDQCMADVTGIPVREGQTVTLFGRDGADVLPVEELADAMDTISYEVVCLVGKRVPRLYCRGDKETGFFSYLL